MLWNQTAQLTLVDAVILGLCTLAVFHLRRQRLLLQTKTGVAGINMILAGLLLTSLFYLADLVAMHALPFFVAPGVAADFTTNLHVNVRWSLSLVSIAFITVGVVLTQRRLLGLSTDLETQQSVTRQELESLEKLTEDLRLSERLLTETQRRLRLGNWTFDLRSHHLVCSEEARRLFGLDRTTRLTVPDTFLDMVVAEDRPLLTEAFAKLQDSQQPQEISFRITQPDGERRTLHISAHRETEAEEAGRLRGTIQDVTEWTHTAVEVSEGGRDDVFESLFDLVEDGVMVVDREMRTVLINPGMAQILGRPDEEIIGRSLFEFMDEDSVRIAREGLEQDGEGQRAGEIRFLKKDGSPITTLLQSARATEGDGGRRIIVAHVVDTGEAVREEAGLPGRVDLEQQLSDIATRLIGVEPAAIDRTVDRMLEATGTYLGAESGQVFLFSEDAGDYRLTHEWRSESVAWTVGSEKGERLGSDGIPWLTNRVRGREGWTASSIDELPPEAAAEAAHFRAQGLEAFIAVPVMYAEEVVGFTILAASRETDWSSEARSLLSLLGRIIADALNRKHGEEAMEAALVEARERGRQLEADNAYLKAKLRHTPRPEPAQPREMPKPPDRSQRNLRVAERDHIVATLKEVSWVIEGEQGAATLLGVAPSTLRSKMKRLGIQRPVS